MIGKKKIIVVMPAYNAEKTLERTFHDIPRDIVDECILVDDGSQDGTVEISKKLGIKTIVHAENRGYGENLKTCFTEALKNGADIIIVLHPDYQYDPTKIPRLVQPIIMDKYDAILGSRTLLPGNAKKGGMPLYKRLGNSFLTTIQNKVYKMDLTDWATGYKAFKREALERIRYLMNSDDFLFDEEINSQLVFFGFRVGQVSIPTRYFEECSSINFILSTKYGFGTLYVLCQYVLHKCNIIKYLKFRKAKYIKDKNGKWSPYIH